MDHQVLATTIKAQHTCHPQAQPWPTAALDCIGACPVQYRRMTRPCAVALSWPRIHLVSQPLVKRSISCQDTQSLCRAALATAGLLQYTDSNTGGHYSSSVHRITISLFYTVLLLVALQCHVQNPQQVTDPAARQYCIASVAVWSVDKT